MLSTMCWVSCHYGSVCAEDGRKAKVVVPDRKTAIFTDVGAQLTIS